MRTSVSDSIPTALRTPRQQAQVSRCLLAVLLILVLALAACMNQEEDRSDGEGNPPVPDDKTLERMLNECLSAPDDAWIDRGDIALFEDYPNPSDWYSCISEAGSPPTRAEPLRAFPPGGVESWLREAPLPPDCIDESTSGKMFVTNGTVTFRVRFLGCEHAKLV